MLYVEALVTTSRYRAKLWGLVLLAVGIPNRVDEIATGYSLLVPEDKLVPALRELELYAAENRNWPPSRQFGEVEMTGRRPPTVLLMGGLLIFHVITGAATDKSEWFRQGAVDSLAILRDGEWWRLVTALTLHADPVHLLGNLVIGGTVIHFLCKVLGTGLGWLLLMVAGTIGNLANVLARGGGHHSVGFSTAVFAAIGLLCGGQMRQTGIKGVLLPVGAGLALLALLGSSGQRTDLGAHFWGLLAGIGFGLLWSRFGGVIKIKMQGAGQIYLLGVTLLLVILAWRLALAA